MAHVFRILDDVDVPLRDGTVLKADAWLPAGEGPWPVLLQRTPYRREDVHGAQYISALEFQAALRRGFAVVVQDTRGRWASGGSFDPFVHERDDGVDTIDWLRRQEFCDGRVAMFGASYVGATQVLPAAARPDGLVAIAPQLTTARHGETWTYRGGAVELGFLLLWIIEALAGPDLDRRMPDLDPAAGKRLRATLLDLQRDPYGAFARLPILDDDIEALAPYARAWFDAARAAASTADREHLDALSSSGTPPMLVTAGWNDLFVDGSIELFEAAFRAGGPHRLIVGPWSHGNPKDWQGDVWHGYAASTAFLSDAQLDFFAAIISGREPSSPVVLYFRTGADDWREASAWPIPGTRTVSLHLSGAGLTEAPPTEAGARRWTSDTLHPVPTTGGATFLPGLLLGRNSGARDQSAVEARDDVLAFTSEPLEGPLEVTGLVTARLFVSSSAPTCDWTARLCEVHADGRSFGLVDGILRRTSGEEGRVEQVEVRLGYIGHVFAAGSRIRLQIASSNFPRYDRNPQSRIDPALATAADFRPAEQTVFFGAGAPSRLVLPVVPG